MLNCLIVGVGGFIGSVCRYIIGQIPMRADTGFPFKTLIINVTGAFLIGLIISLADRSRIANPQIVIFLKIGICGGFTTFSTFAYELGALISTGRVLMGVAYALLSTVLGVLAVYAGLAICR